MKFGVFTQAFNSNPADDFDTHYGLDSYTVQVPNITATSTTPQSAGGAPSPRRQHRCRSVRWRGPVDFRTH